MNNASTTSRMHPPQLPFPPEIEGHLKKLKRKTGGITGGWNKRWFFVDPKRREFGYAKSKAPNIPRCSIYLNDITAIVQFDDTHFQVESRTRNFFLCGESKTSTACWVRSLDEYRRKLIDYEREKATFDARMSVDDKPALGIHGREDDISPKVTELFEGLHPPSGEYTSVSTDSKRPALLDALQAQRDAYSSSSSLASASSSSSTLSSSSKGNSMQRLNRQKADRETRPPSHVSPRDQDRRGQKSQEIENEPSGDKFNQSKGRTSRKHQDKEAATASRRRRDQSQRHPRETQLDMQDDHEDTIVELAPGAHAIEASRMADLKLRRDTRHSHKPRNARHGGSQRRNQPIQAWVDEF